MTSRFTLGSVAVALFPLLGPTAAPAQEVVIAHDAIECIVAGKFPKLDACFTPVSQVGKARVYFRPETLTTWFYVEMTAEEACHTGVLPKPTKQLVDKKIYYYVDVQSAGTARTQEYAPVVVAREEDCEELPAAPVAATGPPAVYPSLPAGFGGAGISGAVIAAGVAGIIVTGGTAIITDDDDTPRGGPPTVPVVTAPPSTTLPTPGTNPTPPPISPLVVACEAAPRSGAAPLRVQFATFPTGGTGAYEFLWSFGDGNVSPNPNPANVFLDNGVYAATVRVTSGDQVVLCTRSITVAPLPEPSPSPSPSPSPTIVRLKVEIVGTGGRVTGPGIDCPRDCEEDFLPGTVVTLTASPSASPPGAFKEWTGHCTGTGPCVVTMDSNRNVVAHFDRAWTLTLQAGASSDVPGSVTSNPSGIACSWPPTCAASATYLDNTTVTLGVTTGGGTVRWGGACSGTPATSTACTLVMTSNLSVTVDTLSLATVTAKGADTKPTFAPLQFMSQLEVPDGEGQVVTNGQLSSAAQAGRSSIAVERRAGTNRVEAVLVRGAGRPGLWRFELSGQRAFRPGSLRVVAGVVAAVAGDAVVFQLKGRPGERIVFTFDAGD